MVRERRSAAARSGLGKPRPAYLEQRARIDFAELPIEALESRHLGYRRVTRDRWRHDQQMTGTVRRASMGTASKTHGTGRIEVKTYEPQPYE
jgi:hypothetical protein